MIKETVIAAILLLGALVYSRQSFGGQSPTREGVQGASGERAAGQAISGQGAAGQAFSGRRSAGQQVSGQQPLDVSAVRSLLQRIVKDKASRFEIAYIAPENGKDVFEVADGSGTGKVLLRGSNGVSVASALNYYLKNYCHSLITWNGENLRIPAVLPAVQTTVHKTTPYTYRYYLNYCTFQYSMAWWDWERWQREIDWMALNGINMPLALTGEEAIWQQVYRAMGFTDKELDRFFSGPAYFSWLWMGNIDAWGGPLPAHWKETHLALQQKILQAERALGMKAVLPAFTGHVPPSFKDRFPAAKVKKTNWDAGFDDVYILDPSDPLFETVGRKFLEAQTAAFGTDHLYSADTFNENVPPTSDSSYLDEMSKKVFASMALADPKAVWVMQGWMFHYNASFWKPAQIQGLLNAVPDDHMIVLDLYSESHPVWNRTSSYYGKPWIWNMLHNFGGNISLWGRMSHVAADPSAALHDPASGKMVGIGLTPEGIEQNPALYQLMLENVWQDRPVGLAGWLRQYARERYGVSSGPIDEAWRLLEASVYRGGLGEGGQESIIVARPTFEKKIDRVLTDLDYDPLQLVKAWGLFAKEAPLLKANDGYRYDLVDITRQVLANYASPLQQRWVEAYRQKDVAAYKKYSRQFLELLDDMDRLLGTRKDFLLGKWIAEARANGAGPAEKDLYERNARDLVTLWGDKNSELREYSNRQWSGLIRGFYKPRWELFFRYLDAALAKGQEPDLKDFTAKVKDQEWKWVNSHDPYPAVAQGDPVEQSLALYKKYSEVLRMAGAPVSIVPQPVSLLMTGEPGFRITPALRIVVDGEDGDLKQLGESFADLLAGPLGFRPAVGQGADWQGAGSRETVSRAGRESGGAISLSLSKEKDTTIGREGYRLEVRSLGIGIVANEPAGLFYGMQSLLQMLPAGGAGDQTVNGSAAQPAGGPRNQLVQTDRDPMADGGRMANGATVQPVIPAVKIVDYPRFGWRGLMLDVSRHYFPKDVVKRYIDQLARYKFNVFHWHLSDDQGWRIEIKSLPGLTQTGAWRVARTGQWWTFQPPGKEEKADYVGYYTQEDIREIVRYASERYVTILPEIDVPGHSLAMIAAYPGLSSTGLQYAVNPGSKFYGEVDNALCPGNEQVFEVLDKVFTEVAALFPGPYIHIGGDEAYKGFWKDCPKCRKRMEDEHLKTVEELQSYFIKRLEKILLAKNKKLIGWDEILEGGLAPEATVMSWRGMDGGIQAARQGHPVVMTPAGNCYLDLYQGDPSVEPDTYGRLRLKDCYDFEPVPQGISEKYILGGQGNLWTESVYNERHVQYMTWPRGLALAEVLWSPREKKDWSGFVKRMEKQMDLFDAASVNYSRSAYDPIVEFVREGKEKKIAIHSELPGVDLYYSFDNGNPDSFYPRYTSALSLPAGASWIRVAAYRNGRPIGKQINLSVAELDKRSQD
ncbi:MAG: alpha-N-acetylglucosaminidase TIM-barrel domain-containing protein [Puia sp.]|nr:alpha-N-acetylglucosaminidase TIM-barrel domain-containing protein [Puia sp.]